MQSLTYSCTSSSAFLIHSTAHPGFGVWFIAGTPPRTLRVAGTPARRRSETEVAGPQGANLVAKRRRLLEIEVGGRRLHLLIERRDVRLELLIRAERRPQIAWITHRGIIAVVDAR